MKRPSLFLLVLAILTACSKNKPKNVEPVTNIFYDKAFEFRNSNLKDSAFFYFDRARDMFIKQKDSLGIGKCLVNMAIISTDNGDYTGGQKASIDAISFFNEKNKKQHPYITSNYNNLGVATYSQAKYLQAIKFYDLAIKFTKNPDDISLYLNNKATAYQELKQYGQALTIFNQILKSATKDSLKYAMVLNNIAFTKFLENPAYDADPDLLRALQIRENANDLFGKNSSYATLADYYAKENPALALSFAQKMYRVAKKTNIANDKLQALQKLIRLSPAGETKQYFELYNKLDDSVEVARGTTENRFVLAKYEYEKNKSDNLTLLKFKAENRLIFYGLLLIFGLIVSYTIFWYQ
ncbi:MAG: tetratricopeptide repeat protein, partial [Pedobacter sp.]